MSWVDLIAGAYTALCLTMWGTAMVYARKAWKSRRLVDLATLLLMTGISMTFIGHGIDQTFWTASNLERAFSETHIPMLTKWYSQNIPAAIVVGKYLASAGAFLHLYVALHDDPSLSVGERASAARAIFGRYSMAWVSIVILVALLA